MAFSCFYMKSEKPELVLFRTMFGHCLYAVCFLVLVCITYLACLAPVGIPTPNPDYMTHFAHFFPFSRHRSALSCRFLLCSLCDKKAGALLVVSLLFFH